MASAHTTSHIVLLGDSVFDNAAYVDGGPDVLAQLRALLPTGWRADSVAIDGSMIGDIPAQLERVPTSATHLVVSVGGNDALSRVDVLQAPVASSTEALQLLEASVAEFGRAYRDMLAACRRLGRPAHVFTIYEGNFDDEAFCRAVRAAVAVYDDAIVRAARDFGFDVIELRDLCRSPEHFANPIEPSVAGGARIARSIVTALRQRAPVRA
jgi:hypothetical protein